MIRSVSLSLFWLFAVLGIAFEARSAELELDYLMGTWVLHGGECADDNAQFVDFRKNGAVEIMRDGKLEAAGFWKLEDEFADLHVIASPAFFQKDFEAKGLKAMEGQFYAFRIRLLPLNAKADVFEGVGILGEQVRHAVFNRCKS